MSKTILERLTSTDEGMKLFQREKLVLDFTEIVCKKLEGCTASRDYVARKIGYEVETINSFLDEGENLDLEVVADIAWALDITLTFNVEPLTIHTKPDEESRND